MNFNSAAQPDDYWNTPEGQQANEWYQANPGGGAAEYLAQNVRPESDSGGNYRLLSTGSAGGAGGTTGEFPDGWQYPINDPGAAVRNYLRSQGKQWNPFGAYQRMLDQFSSGLLPQFLAQQATKTGDTSSMSREFGDFIGGRYSGAIAAPTLNQSTAHLGQLNSLQQQILQVVNGPLALLNNERAAAGLPPVNISTEEGRAALMAFAQKRGGMGLNINQLAVGGMMNDPQTQMALYLAAYLPALGPAMSQGLGKIVGTQKGLYDDYLGPIVESKNRSFLDFLTGSMNLSARYG